MYVGSLVFWVFYVGVYVALLIGVLVWVWRTRIRTVFQAQFFRASGDEKRLFVKVGAREFRKSDRMVSFRGQSFPVDLANMAFTDRRKTVLAFDIDREKALFFGGSREFTGAGIMDVANVSGLIERVVRGVKGVDRLVYMVVFICIGCAVLAFALGVFASPYVLPKVTPERGVIP